MHEIVVRKNQVQSIEFGGNLMKPVVLRDISSFATFYDDSEKWSEFVQFSNPPTLMEQLSNLERVQN